ncbi:LytR/AlgR family response regulator transcription factor [Saccharicrinis sp. FJH54]|uniref:LytR/AlgR family response regulator transcription factor n=1 Tax=Saccharicrinis sp. FJH54 TaxID=3344665 RepID=UPI0035D3F72A
MRNDNKRNIRLLIIEDEAHNSRMLKDMIENLRPAWNIEAILESVEDSVSWFRNHLLPDLILMDIQLSDGICFSIFKAYEGEITSRIIFTTAYDEYAIRAFKVNSIDYLLKPVNAGELDQAFLKFEKLIATERPDMFSVQEEKEYISNLFKSIVSGKREHRTRFLISGIQGYQKLEAKDIAYIYSDNKLSFAVDFSKKEYTLDYTLEQVESELDPDRFFRANRKCIVSIDAVKKITNDLGGKLIAELSPPAPFEVSVSRLKAGEFKIWMGK